MPTLEFTTMARCPLQCSFCPQDKLKAAYGSADIYMSLGTFQIILDKVPKHVRIDFSGMSEPWANPCATDMLRYALQLGYNVAIYTTLYGMDDHGTEVFDLLLAHSKQLEVLCLHLPDANGNMRGWKYSQTYERNLKLFMTLRHQIGRFEVMTMNGTGQIHPDLAHLGIEIGSWVGHSRAGNISAPSGQAMEATPRHESAVMCAFTPFYDQNTVLPNGDVTLCCMDYGEKHRIGNLLKQNYYDIFAGQELGAVRAENMQPRFSDRSLCKSCNRASRVTVGPSKQFWVTRG